MGQGYLLLSLNTEIHKRIIDMRLDSYALAKKTGLPTDICKKYMKSGLGKTKLSIVLPLAEGLGITIEKFKKI